MLQVSCGADVFLALARAARVTQVIENFVAELALTMALVGAASISEVTRELLVPAWPRAVGLAPSGWHRHASV